MKNKVINHHLANIRQFLLRSYSLEKWKGHVKLDHMEYLSLRPETNLQIIRNAKWMNLYLVQYVSEKIVTDIVLKHPKLCFTPMKKC